MCKKAIILLLLILGVMIVLPHRRLAVRAAPEVPPPPAYRSPDVAAPEVPPPPGYESPDAAEAMRSLSGATTSPAVDSKLWATDYARFVNEHPGRQWAIGRSHPCLSEAEAAASAQADAAAKVLPRVLARLGDHAPNVSWVKQAVGQEVRSGRLDVDRLAERFDRPYGKVWTESILLDVSPDKLDPIVRQYQMQSHARQIGFQRRLGVAGTIIFVSCLLYVLLNAMTKGYFTLRLRVAAAAIVFAAVLILLV